MEENKESVRQKSQWVVVYKNKILAASISYKTGEEAVARNSSHKKTEAKGEKKEWHSQTRCELSTNAMNDLHKAFRG